MFRSDASRRCSFDFHGECEQCVLRADHAGLHICVHVLDEQDPDLEDES